MTKPHEVASQRWCQIRLETHVANQISGSYGDDTPDAGIAEVARLIEMAGQREFARVTVIVRAAGGPWKTETDKLALECHRPLGLSDPQRDRIRAALGTGALAKNVDIEVTFSGS